VTGIGPWSRELRGSNSNQRCIATPLPFTKPLGDERTQGPRGEQRVRGDAGKDPGLGECVFTL
jgi:hypothetical protein